MKHVRLDHQNSWSPRPRVVNNNPDTVFIPLTSHVEAVRQAQTFFANGMNTVVIHGPRGSGRSMVARQIARLLHGKCRFLFNPAHDFQLQNNLAIHASADASRYSGSESHLIVDSLTASHQGWHRLIQPEQLDASKKPGKTIIVSTTMWWLTHAQQLQADIQPIGLSLLNRDEITHLANGLLWIKSPRAAALSDEIIDRIDLESEGLVAQVVHMVRQHLVP